MAAKLALIGLIAMATAGLLSLMVTWWSGPIDRAGGFPVTMGQLTMPVTDMPGAWIISNKTITPSGHVFVLPDVAACQTGTQQESAKVGPEPLACQAAPPGVIPNASQPFRLSTQSRARSAIAKAAVA